MSQFKGEVKKYESDPFFNVKFTYKETSEGKVELPILYFNVENVIAFFKTDKNRVDKMLENTPYKLGLSIGKKAIVGISFYKYNQTGIGPYNEVGLALPVLLKQDKHRSFLIRNLLNNYSKMVKRRLGYYILDLPVTTSAAYAAGKEIWGYPKFVTNIQFSLNKRQFTSKVMDPDNNSSILSISGKIGIGFKVPPFSLLLYSSINGNEIKTPVIIRGWMNFGSGKKIKLNIGDSSHQMAEHLRELGLNGKKPFVVLHTNKFQSRLHDGIIISQ